MSIMRQIIILHDFLNLVLRKMVTQNSLHLYLKQKKKLNSTRKRFFHDLGKWD